MKSKINLNLEVLRGFAAVLVVLGHLIYHHTDFNKNYYPHVLNPLAPPGHLAVLIFFILSGYVIGINQEMRLQGKGIWIYLKKRLTRIYPVYFLAITFALIIANHFYSIPTILSNYTLTQNIKYQVIWENNPAWSLNFEFLYYLLFIGISFFQIRSVTAFIFTLIIGIGFALTPFNDIISSYAVGFCFWVAGLYMARNLKHSDLKLKILPLLLYILSIEDLMKFYKNRFGQGLELLHIDLSKTGHLLTPAIITVADLIYLPFCFMIVLFFSGKEIKWQKQIFLSLQIIPLSAIFIAFITHSITNDFVMGIVYYLLACSAYFIKEPKELIIKYGAWLGSISYGLYIIHFPILYSFGLIFTKPHGLVIYLVEIISFLAISFAAAWFLEKKVQYFIKLKLK